MIQYGTRARLDPKIGKIIIPVKRYIVFLAGLKSLFLISLCGFFMAFPLYTIQRNNLHYTDPNTLFLTMISFGLCIFLLLVARRINKYRGKTDHEIKLSPHELEQLTFHSDLLINGAYVINIGKRIRLFGVINLQVFMDGQRIARAQGFPVA